MLAEVEKMTGLRRFSSTAVSKRWQRAAYRAGTAAGGRNDDRGLPEGFAATRFPLSMDSR